MHLVQHYNDKYRAWGQPLLQTLVTTSDNCAAQFRSRYHFAWMVDFAEEAESISTGLAIYLAEYHGKGPADSAAGGAKTKANEAAVYGPTIETAYDLYIFLNAHYKQVGRLVLLSYAQKNMSLFKTSFIPALHRLLKHTTKLCTKYTVESSITSRKELYPLTFIETQLRYLLSKKIIA